MDVPERDDDALVGRKIHACNTGHDFTPVPAGRSAAPPFLPVRKPEEFPIEACKGSSKR
jgi:hypothetical protein